MITIYKYPLKRRNELETIYLPMGALFLSVQYQAQSGELCLWAMVDADAPIISRTVYALGTGIEAPSLIGEMKYLGTAQENFFVWHVFGKDWFADPREK